MLKRIHLDFANVDTDGLADGLTGEGPWAADDLEATSIPDGLAHQLNLTSPDDLSGVTLTLTGTDADGNEITEAVTGPNQTTVETANYFRTLTNVEASETLGGDELDIGWVDDVASESIPLRWFRNVNSKMFYVETGTVASFTVQFTIADIQNKQLFPRQELVPWFAVNASLDAETASSTAIQDIAAGYTAFRIVVTGYSSGAEATLYASQPTE